MHTKFWGSIPLLGRLICKPLPQLFILPFFLHPPELPLVLLHVVVLSALQDLDILFCETQVSAEILPSIL